jgi:NOL1/NOP2/fmu family ribosome biogenesis protein
MLKKRKQFLEAIKDRDTSLLYQYAMSVSFYHGGIMTVHDENTQVVHCKRDYVNVYIGRKLNTQKHYGNPFSHKNLPHTIKCNTREESIENFRRWMMGETFKEVEPGRRDWILMNLEKLRGQRLGCFCAPKACHGDVYIEMLKRGKPKQD